MYVLEVFIPSCGEGIHLLINRFLDFCCVVKIILMLLIFLTLF